VLMVIAGWIEGVDATFTIVPGTLRNLIYALRLLTGVLMLFASLDWLRDSLSLRSVDQHSPKSYQEAA